ncbi:hypothetical protein GCM10010214_12590 [Streptomyces abikoensis]|nr:hypothetical protein GCM10010214_12590 [Streptomyces abikoensis]
MVAKLNRSDRQGSCVAVAVDCAACERCWRYETARPLQLSSNPGVTVGYWRDPVVWFADSDAFPEMRWVL